MESVFKANGNWLYQLPSEYVQAKWRGDTELELYGITKTDTMYMYLIVSKLKLSSITLWGTSSSWLLLITSIFSNTVSLNRKSAEGRFTSS